jgi:iron complex outermembrane receptor protein
MRKKWLCHSVGLTFAFAATCGGAAFAADATAAPDEGAPAAGTTEPLEQVIVTATKRSVALKDVDASLSVLTADMVRTANVTSLNDVAPLVPNFQFAENFRVGIPYITMRGVPTAQGGEAPVAVVVDGVQAPGLEFINQDLINIEDVEVLRGPQGALYGRGAIAGAIIINTQKPTNDLSGEVIASYGNGNTSRVVGTIAGPIVEDRLWIRVTGQERHSDGLIEDIGLHAKADTLDERVGRLELLARPDDLTTIDLKAAHTNAADGADVVAIVPLSEIANPSFQHPDRNVKDVEHRIINMYSLKIDRDLHFATLTSISQYAYSTQHMFGDADFTPQPLVLQSSGVQSRAYNQDLRLTSPSDQSFKWLVGAFYQRRDDRNAGYDSFDPAGTLCCGTFNAVDERASSTAYAAYGQAIYDFAAGFKLSAALRYDVDQRFDEDRLTPGSQIRHNFHSTQPLITLSRKWTEDLMTYLTFGKGFRSGGFNAYPDAVHLGVPRLYPLETTKNYEGGFKSQWFDHKLSVNAAVFHTDFENQQFYFINIEPLSRDIVTFPSTSLNGGELEISYSPIARLQLGAGLGVLDSKVTKANLPIYDGNHSPLVNNYSVDLSVQYRRPLFDQSKLNWLARVDYHRLGDIYYDQTGLASFGPTNFVDARLGLETDVWSVAFIGKNLSDTMAPTLYFPNVAGNGIGATVLNKPRYFAVEASYRF